MTKINIKEFATNEHTNNGINKEHALCKYYGIERNNHDATPYNEGSDIELENANISIKSSRASLMSGNYCKTCKTFAGIWRKYSMNTHSDTFAYITDDYIAYIMNKKEFSKFMHTFAGLSRESQKNGGHIKIQIRKESAKMVEWLEERVA